MRLILTLALAFIALAIFVGGVAAAMSWPGWACMTYGSLGVPAYLAILNTVEKVWACEAELGL